MFSFFIGLAIALFIAIAGFGGFLFKLSNANKADMESNRFALPETPQQPANTAPISEMESEEALSHLDAPVSKPDFSAGSF